MKFMGLHISKRSGLSLSLELLEAFPFSLLLGIVTCFMVPLIKSKCQGHNHEILVDFAVYRRLSFGQLRRFSWRELQLATHSFSEKNILGQGGFGKFYKGVPADNTKVGVKRLTDYERLSGDAVFQQKVELISVAVHKTLDMVDWLLHNSYRTPFCVPFMPNLSVAHCITGIIFTFCYFCWRELYYYVCIRVALGTARGFEYNLHEHCNPKIIHRDVLAANVLLFELCSKLESEILALESWSM